MFERHDEQYLLQLLADATRAQEPSGPPPGKRTLTSRLASTRPAASASPIQRKAAGPRRVATDPRTDAWMAAAVRPDANAAPNAMPAPVRARMERSFGADFSSVRIHQGGRAAAAGALAYTQGEDIHFAPGQYAPDTDGGMRLLGHELAHVVQQREGRVRPTRQAAGLAVNDNDGLEREADLAGDRAARGELAGSTSPSAAAGTAMIQRKDAPASDAGAIDWMGLLKTAGIDLALETGKLIPIAGGIEGFVLDMYGTITDMQTAGKSGSAPIFFSVAIRDFVALFSAAASHATYVNQLCTDALAAGIITSELAPLSAAFQELPSGLELGLTSAQTILDAITMLMLDHARHNPVNTRDEQAALDSLFVDFTTNTMQDFVSVLLSAADFSSGGIANTETISRALKWLGVAFKSADDFGAFLINYLVSVGFKIGKDTFTGVTQKKDDGTGAAAPAGILAELGNAGAAYDMGTSMYEAGLHTVDGVFDELETFRDELTTNKSPLMSVRDTAVAALDDMELRLATLQQFATAAETADAECTTLEGELDKLEALLELLVLPDLTLPEHTEIGDDPVSDAIEGVVDTGAELANGAIEAAVAALQEGIDVARDMVTEALAVGRSGIDEVRQTIAELAPLVAEQIASLEGHVESFRAALAEAQDPEAVIDALLSQIAALLGEDAVTVDDFRQLWGAIGDTIADATAWAQGLTSGG